MSISEDLHKAEERPDDVIAAVLRDHAEIRRLFGEVEAASDPEAKEAAVNQLVRKLVVHETAEQEIVHPLARRAEDPQAGEVVEERLSEEKEAEHVLASLEDMDVTSTEFEERFAALQADVLDHAEAEEEEEHPRIDGAVDPDRLRQLASVFNVAEKAAPTRPHPHGPTSAAGNIAVGPIVGIADRVRDAIRDAG